MYACMYTGLETSGFALSKLMRINFKPNVNHFRQIIYQACEPFKVVLRVTCFAVQIELLNETAINSNAFFFLHYYYNANQFKK